jgi:hypothetical protein
MYIGPEKVKEWIADTLRDMAIEDTRRSLGMSKHSKKQIVERDLNWIDHQTEKYKASPDQITIAMENRLEYVEDVLGKKRKDEILISLAQSEVDDWPDLCIAIGRYLGFGKG